MGLPALPKAPPAFPLTPTWAAQETDPVLQLVVLFHDKVNPVMWTSEHNGGTHEIAGRRHVFPAYSPLA